MESAVRSHRQRGGMAVLGSNPVKRRATPIPVLPPRIPTPMPAVNNNNHQTRIVTGGNTKTNEQFLKKRIDSQDITAPITNTPRICPKYLDNDNQTVWINPRLISKIDLEAVTSKDYTSAPVVKSTTNNMNNGPSPVNAVVLQQQQQPPLHHNHYNYSNGGTSVPHQNNQPHHHHQQKNSGGATIKSERDQSTGGRVVGVGAESIRGETRSSSVTAVPPPPRGGHAKAPRSGSAPSSGSAGPLFACAGSLVNAATVSASTGNETVSVPRRAERSGHNCVTNSHQSRQPHVVPSSGTAHTSCSPNGFLNNMKTQVIHQQHHGGVTAANNHNGNFHNVHNQVNNTVMATSQEQVYNVSAGKRGQKSGVNPSNVTGSHIPSNSASKHLGSSKQNVGGVSSSKHTSVKVTNPFQNQYGASKHGASVVHSVNQSNNYGFKHSPYQISSVSAIYNQGHHETAASLNTLGVLSGSSASSGGIFGMYTETKYTFAMNGIPGNPSQASAAAAFFARASQKLNLSSSPHRRKRHSSGDEEVPATGFCGVIQRSPPPVPPALLRRIGVREITGVGKVKVMLRVSSSPSSTSPAESTSNTGAGSFFNLDKRRKQVTLFDPATVSTAPAERRVGVAAPKMFAFDAIFSPDDSQTEVCSSALTDVIHAVINGTDGCLFCFGHAGLGKTYTMLGRADNANTLGVIPCAIAWLFRGIDEQKQRTGARFSVRVSAVEVCGPSNTLRDLLAGHANDSEQSPGVYLRDDPVFGAQLQNHSELRVPTAERAAFYLDAAIECRSSNGYARETIRDSHLLYTLHVYQYSVAGKGGVAGGRSRLHLIDLGNSDRGKSSGGIPLSGLGNILLAVFNGQKHLPYKEHKLTHVLKECLSSLTCHAAMIAHVSPCAQNYTDTLTTVQLASRIHRMRRRKIKFVPASGATGSGGSSGEEATRTTGTSSEPDPSSSDLSADTVIYVGPTDDATDGEHPPVYIPSLNSGDNRCAMGKALRGSGVENKPFKVQSKIEEKSPQKCNSLTKQSTQSTINKQSPVHINSAKSSPVRAKPNLKTTLPHELQTGNKVAYFNTNPVSSSDEQWIDGPRISKHKVAEARFFMKEAGHVKKRETWIDGPLQANSLNLASHSNANNGYGYMDSHKKRMIRKWVENQTTQVQKTKHVGKPDHKTTVNSKDVNGLRISEDDDSQIKEVNPLVEDSWKKQEIEKAVIQTGLKMSIDKCSSDIIPECTYAEKLESPINSHTSDILPSREKYDVEGDDDEEIIFEIPPALPLIQPLSSREVSMESLDVRLKERLHSNPDLDDNNSHYANLMDDEDDEVLEIIEVEEPLEPVPMQDSCLQVTEEDIALCMGSLENPLPEDEQGNPEEHPLRILSQENLTVVSTFTDSMSVFTDLERTLPGNRYGLSTYALPNTRTHSIYSDDYEDPDCPAPDLLRNINPDDTSRRKFEQLARLHKLYTNHLAKANVTNSITYKENKQQQKCLSRCESLSLSEMLYGNAHETGSIYSEPPYRPDQEKFCENCKISMSRPATAQNWYADPQLSASATHLASMDNLTNVGGRFQRFCHKNIRDSFNIASLRHPDGASNPNLKEEMERIPGNGASNNDNRNDVLTRTNERIIPGETPENAAILHPLPLPLNIPPDEQINKRLLSIGTDLTNLKLTTQEGYDSGHDSTPRTSKHSPAAVSRRAESGYASVARGDSESSSIDSDVSRRSLQTRSGKYKHKHDRSFCSWLLNPFTCKHIEEPPETHF